MLTLVSSCLILSRLEASVEPVAEGWTWCAGVWSGVACGSQVGLVEAVSRPSLRFFLDSLAQGSVR